MTTDDILRIKSGALDGRLEELAIAITQQAALDYEEELKKSEKLGKPTSELRALNKWFKSDFGQLCTFGNGAYIQELIRNGTKVVVPYLHHALTRKNAKWIREHYIAGDRKYGVRGMCKKYGVSHGVIKSVLQGRYRCAEDRE